MSGLSELSDILRLQAGFNRVITELALVKSIQEHFVKPGIQLSSPSEVLSIRGNHCPMTGE